MRRVEGNGVEGSKGSSPKSGTSATGLSHPPPPKMEGGTTGSAILDTYLQFIAENSMALSSLHYAQQGRHGSVPLSLTTPRPAQGVGGGGAEGEEKGNGSDMGEEESGDEGL